MQQPAIEGFRLSPQQKRLWLLQQAEPALSPRALCAVLIEGDVQQGVLQAALAHVVDRHEILRTTFKCLPGMTIPLQIITHQKLPPVVEADLSGLSHAEQEAKIENLLNDLSRAPIDFEHGHVLRVSLLKLSAAKHMLVIDMPSLCGDAASLGNLVREIGRVYTACVRGEVLTDEPLQYADISEWQNEMLESADTEKGREYWKNQDFSGLSSLRLPFENRVPAKAESYPASMSVQIPMKIARRIDALSRLHGTSVGVFLLTCWHILLWRLSAEPELIIGTAYDGRNHRDLEGALGLLTRRLPLRWRPEGRSQFTQALTVVNELSGAIADHQDYFDWAQIGRSSKSPGESTSFALGFTFEDQKASSSIGEVSFSIRRQRVCIDQCKLELRGIQTGDSLIADFHYDADFFSAEDIRRVAAQFQALLNSALASPEAAIGELNILDERERQRVLVEWNRTQSKSYDSRCVHELFEAQAERTPDAVAAVFEDKQLTYGELNQRANPLAHHLQDLAVGPESVVGLHLERSLDLLIGLLAVLKAGGAYLPLDPSLPVERLSFMLQQAQVSIIVTQSSLVEKVARHENRVVCLDTDWADIAKRSQANPIAPINSANLAYVLFTSGSTGEPKGVAVEHRQLLNYIGGILQRLDLPPGASFATVSTFAADLGNTAIFPALCSGGLLHIVSKERASDPDALAEYFDRHRVDCLKIVPSHLQALLLTASRPERVLPIRRLVLGGEACTWDLVKKVQVLAPDCLILNHYGPTETTVGVLTHRVDPKESDPDSATVPIGRPIANTQVYLLDAGMRPVPIWVPGELYIGGESVTRGYLGRPELTAEKFVSVALGGDSGTRLYRTGDLARYFPSGAIEFIGRIDGQVKIHGFRVELSEIEIVLAQHPAVREAVVVARETHAGTQNPESREKQLVAYVVASQDRPPTVSELRNFVADRLPEYMVPTGVVFLDSLPLTSNGKVDRRALPAPDHVRPELHGSYVAPRNLVEEMIAEIWVELLNIEHVGIHDDFFDMGGHSLLAMQVVSRLREVFGMDLPLSFLFNGRTVAALAEKIEKARRSEQGLAAPPIEKVSRDDDRPLSFAQQQLWFLDQLMPGLIAYNITGTVRFTGRLDLVALEQSLTEVVRRHETLRTTFRVVDGRPFQRIAPAEPFILSVTDLAPLSACEREAEALRLTTEGARQPFDLTKGPLFRVALLRLGEEDHILQYAMHHAVSDGWSTGIFNKELNALYHSFSTGQSPLLPALPIQYTDFAHWQRQRLHGEVLEAQLCYWKKQLAGVPDVLTLPTDRPRPAVQSFRGVRQTLELSKELSDGLKALSRSEGVTLFMTLLAAFQTLLYRYTGQEDIVVGSPIANRNRSEIEGLIGFFVNTLVLRTDLSGTPTFRELLQRVRKMALEAYEHQDLPFEKLVEELKPERNLSYSPLFQVLFNMLSSTPVELDLAGITATRILFSDVESKFEMSLYSKEEQHQIHLDLVCRADLFDEFWMTNFLQQYRHLLDQIVKSPAQSIRNYSLVTPESRELLPDPSIILGAPRQELITDTFLSWAKLLPTHTAVSQGDQRWTYSELADCSYAIARLLTASGLQAGDAVAICGGRSFGLIAGLIGTLLGGGVILTLDTNLPVHRQQLMVREANAKRLLCTAPTQGADSWMEETFGAAILFVDPQRGCPIGPEASLDSESSSLAVVSDDDPAYIFFTSGTTGLPKGVLGCHKGLSHFLKWQRETFNIGPDDRVAQLTNLSFDASLRDIFLPLTSGATLCLPDDGDIVVSDDVIAWLDRQRISVLHTVPSLAQSWLAFAEDGGPLPAMRWVFFVGEPLTDALVCQWRSDFGNAAEIINLYGPTETTLVKCFYRVPLDVRPGVQPVGSPIPQTQALVLAHDQQLCGINESGEIVLRTPFRSLGYINAPEESRQRFVMNSYQDDADDLLYFTGDAGRFRPDGTLEILGRLDDQVKIHGVRVEPAEVAAVLAQHPDVESCVVTAEKGTSGDSYLAAYAVLLAPGKATSAKLRSYLLERLPAAMVPAHFVFLDSLPLTPNGKLDRRALPRPDSKHYEPAQSYVAPRSELEKTVAKIWIETLRVPAIGVFDNFFELGGHSLLATQVVSRIRSTIRVELSLRTFFEAPTVAALSEHLQTIRWLANENLTASKNDPGVTEKIML